MDNAIASLFYRYGNVSIIILAVINGIIFAFTFKSEKNMEKLFNPTGDSVLKLDAEIEWDSKKIAELQKKYRSMIVFYTWYANITAVFPLLGILGTVAALMKEVDDIEGLTGNFVVALSTTLWGIFFAILFKCLDARVSGPMEVTSEKANYVNREYERERKEAQKYKRKEAQGCDTAE